MRMSVWISRLGALGALGLLAGCATPPKMVFDKTGVPAAQRQRDEDACLRSAIGIDPQGRLISPFTVDRDAYAQCMRGRGYTAVMQ